jgi:hypothetical protein
MYYHINEELKIAAVKISHHEQMKMFQQEVCKTCDPKIAWVLQKLHVLPFTTAEAPNYTVWTTMNVNVLHALHFMAEHWQWVTNCLKK